jgi:DNA-binding CsgD family transcriptional regulator
MFLGRSVMTHAYPPFRAGEAAARFDMGADATASLRSFLDVDQGKPRDGYLLKNHRCSRIATEAMGGSIDHQRTTRVAQLTAREQEVVLLFAHGASAKSVSQILGLSHRTVEAHASSIIRKLGARN